MILVLCRVLISSLLVIRAAFKWGSGNKGRWSAYGIENYLKRLSSLPCMVRELCLDAGYVLIVSVINHITRRETNYITLWTDVAPAPCTSRQNHIHRSLHLPGQRELKNIWKELNLMIVYLNIRKEKLNFSLVIDGNLDSFIKLIK